VAADPDTLRIVPLRHKLGRLRSRRVGWSAGCVSSLIFFAACHRQPPPGSDLFATGEVRAGAYATLAGPRGDTLLVSATAENRSGQQLMDMLSGGCPPLNRLAVVARRDSRVWESVKWEAARDSAQRPVVLDAAGHPVTMICAGPLRMRAIPPSGLVRYEIRVPINEILGDSLPPGTYAVVARLHVNFHTLGNLRAGEVSLYPHQETEH
jgi:hypothetical protein